MLYRKRCKYSKRVRRLQCDTPEAAGRNDRFSAPFYFSRDEESSVVRYLNWQIASLMQIRTPPKGNSCIAFLKGVYLLRSRAHKNPNRLNQKKGRHRNRSTYRVAARLLIHNTESRSKKKSARPTHIFDIIIWASSIR